MVSGMALVGTGQEQELHLWEQYGGERKYVGLGPKRDNETIPMQNSTAVYEIPKINSQNHCDLQPWVWSVHHYCWA